MISVDTCIVCNAPLVKDKCSNCGYFFSLDFSCPRKIGIRCIHTNKPCAIKNWENCDILRNND